MIIMKHITFQLLNHKFTISCDVNFLSSYSSYDYILYICLPLVSHVHVTERFLNKNILNYHDYYCIITE